MERLTGDNRLQIFFLGAALHIWSKSQRGFESTGSQSEKSSSPNTSGRYIDGLRKLR